jgi:hypothetical protein
MSLRDEFRIRVSLLEHADWQRITPRLAELLRWMSDKPEIVAILHDLKNKGPVYQRLNLGPHPQAHAEVARMAGAEKDIAKVLVGTRLWQLGRTTEKPKSQSFGNDDYRQAITWTE